MRRRAALVLLAAALSPGCPRGPAPVPAAARRGGAAHELRAPLPAGWTPERAMEEGVEAEVRGPDGAAEVVPGFPARGALVVRYTPRIPGGHRYVLRAGGSAVAQGGFQVAADEPLRRGFVRVDPEEPAQLALAGGRRLFVLGENRINVYDPSWNDGALDGAAYVRRMAARGMSTLRVFVFSDVEEEEKGGRPPLGCLEPALGRFDDAVAERFDAVFDAAEASGVKVILVAFAIGFSPEDPWKSWQDNPYAQARGGPAARPLDFFLPGPARAAAARRLRYLAARWGSSPALLAIDLVNEPEWDGEIPETAWTPWAEEMARGLRALDPYRHLVTAGPVGLHWNVEGDERAWYRSPWNDVVQWHLYGKETYQPHALAAELTRKVRETWYGKPVLVGEFGYGGEPKPAYEHTHAGIWAATFSGAGVLAHSAPPFNIDSDEPMTDQRARHFQALSRFLEAVSGVRPLEPIWDAAGADGGVRVWMLGGAGARALWWLAPAEAGDRPRQGVVVRLRGLEDGAWEAEIWDDVEGRPTSRSGFQAAGGRAELELPAFVRHGAAILRRR